MFNKSCIKHVTAELSKNVTLIPQYCAPKKCMGHAYML